MHTHDKLNKFLQSRKMINDLLYEYKDTETILKLNKRLQSKHMSTHPVFLAHSTVCNQMCYLGTEILPDAAAHPMNKISHTNLQRYNQPQI